LWQSLDPIDIKGRNNQCVVLGGVRCGSHTLLITREHEKKRSRLHDKYHLYTSGVWKRMNDRRPQIETFLSDTTTHCVSVFKPYLFVLVCLLIGLHWNFKVCCLYCFFSFSKFELPDRVCGLHTGMLIHCRFR